MNELKKNPSLPLLIALVTSVWLIFFAVVWNLVRDWQVSGVFGDTFGIINSLFSGLAFAAIIYTIYLQKGQLALQSKELTETQKEIKIQNETLKKQSFSSMFFSLLSLHHQMVEKISVTVDGKRVTGAECFRHLNRELKQMYSEKKEQLGKLDMYSLNIHRSAVMNVFTKIYDQHAEDLGQCFSNFVTLASLTKESLLITPEEKEHYFSIIATQIHPCEIVLLFYYFQVGQGHSAKVLFNDLKLQRKMNVDLLGEENHGYLFDSDETVADILNNRR